MSRTKILKSDLETSIQNSLNNISYLGGKVAGTGSLPVTSTQDTVVYVAASKKFVVYRSGTWEDVAGGGGGGGTGATELAALTDVDLTGLADGQILVWSATENKWLAENATIDTSAIEASILILESDVSSLNSNLNLKANINSPSFTGTPTAPNPIISDDSTKIATTAFVKSQGYVTSAGLGVELSVIDGGTF
jgi:hypothetical protein